MPVVNLTDMTVRTIAPVVGKQVTYLDRSLKGFGVRVTENGSKSYVLTYGNDRRRVRIGDTALVSLKDARAKARNILAEYQLGIRKEEPSLTFNDARDLFLAQSEQKNRSRTTRDYRRLFNRHFPFGTKRLTEITAQDINRRIDRLQKTTSEQNHALVAIKVFFKWAQRRQYIEHSPCDTMQTVKLQPRDRLLTDTEVKAIYEACIELDTPFTRIVRICFLTGLRRTEVAWLRRSYFQGDQLIIPASLMKNKREFITPVMPMLRQLVEGIPGDDDRLFPAERGDGVFGGWSRNKIELDKAANVFGWVIHDSRRYFTSTHASPACGTSIAICEKLLHHVSGTFGGIVSVYQRHSFLPEMAKAQAAYERNLTALLSKA